MDPTIATLGRSIPDGRGARGRIFQVGTGALKGGGYSSTSPYSQQYCYGGRDTNQRRNFRGDPGGQKVELPMATPTTLAKGVWASNGKTGEHVCIPRERETVDQDIISWPHGAA